MSDLRLHIWSLLIKWNTQTRCKCSGFNEATTLSRILEFSKRTQRRKWTFKRWNIPQNKFIEKINRIEFDLSNTKQVSYMGQIKNDFRNFFFETKWDNGWYWTTLEWIMRLLCKMKSNFWSTRLIPHQLTPQVSSSWNFRAAEKSPTSEMDEFQVESSIFVVLE